LEVGWAPEPDWIFCRKDVLPLSGINWKLGGPQNRTGYFAEKMSYPCQESINDSRDYFKDIGYVPLGLTFKTFTFCFKVFCLFHMILLTKHILLLYPFSFTAFVQSVGVYCAACPWQTHNSEMVSDNCTYSVD
jgi:hypothetical protein